METNRPEAAPAATPRLLMTSIDSAAGAETLAATLVEARLAACVQVVPMTSVYRWHGQVRRDAEWLLLIKTAARVEDVERLLRAQHSYAVPELLWLPIEGGSADYLQWLRAESRAAAADGSV